MDVTAGTRATAISAAVVMAAGLTIILYGVVRNDLARSLGGACLTMTSLTLIALVAIKRWVTDTSEDRRLLAASIREAQAEKSRYFAAKAALENEQGRLTRDAAIDRRRAAVAAMAEREALHQQFEEKRAQLVCETFEMAFEMARQVPDEHARADDKRDVVIQFPVQQQEQAPARARSRGHNVVGP
ncbi:hypothetical protein [Streptomyces sp. NPDC090798]|uniref:hypothetical protein n=1 Tax=Streptomyces sp. NPDC090798 TaxID=3365968 RepID=UPI00382EDFD2